MNSKHPNPPPPHQPQAHYYGTPDIDFGMAQQGVEQNPPTKALWSSFDSLASAGEGSRPIEDVLIVGASHGIDVYGIGKTKPTWIGCLEGLPGRVLSAKILPVHSGADSLRSSRPLVAITSYGLFEPSDAEAPSKPDPGTSGDSLFDPSTSMMHALHHADKQDASPSQEAALVQASVDIYSLGGQRHLRTLYRSPRIEMTDAQSYSLSQSPPPEANLSIQASGRFLAVASGASGEIHVFENGAHSDSNDVDFRCLGKFWTRTTHRRSRSLSMSSDSSEAGSCSGTSTAQNTGPGAAIFSLSQRWLALVPPIGMTQQTMHGKVIGVHLPSKVPGLTSHTAPSEPPVTCETDTPEAESFSIRLLEMWPKNC